MADEAPPRAHRFSGYPGAICLDCFVEDALESCVAVHNESLKCVEGHLLCTAHPPNRCKEHVNGPCPGSPAKQAPAPVEPSTILDAVSAAEKKLLKYNVRGEKILLNYKLLDSLRTLKNSVGGLMPDPSDAMMFIHGIATFPTTLKDSYLLSSPESGRFVLLEGLEKL